MINSILFVMWFFAPAGLANLIPVIMSKIPYIKKFNAPLDCGLKLRGKPLFGDHKTWRGFISGVLISIATLALQVYLYNHVNWFHSLSRNINYDNLPVLGLGFLFALGALGGDAIESMFKRQFSIDPGKKWFPFDQIDYILGGIIASSLIVRLSLIDYLWLLLVWLILHLVFSFFAYLFKLKDSPI